MSARVQNRIRGVVLALMTVTSGAASVAAAGERIGEGGVKELRALFEQAAAAAGTVGAQVSAIVGDQTIDFVYGTANAELNTPMTVDTIVQIGSTTKMLNAATVMTLVDEGKLALDTPVTQYIPDLKLAGARAPDDVTLRRLLSMSAGLDMGPTTHFQGEDALAHLVAAMSEMPLNYPTGKGFGYSNASVCVSAYAAQLIGGQSWDTLLKKRVLEPAGITHFANLPEDLAFQRVAVGHTLIKSGEAPQLMRPWISDQGAAPAGLSVAISAHDLALFGQLFINAGRAANGNRVLSEAAVKNMMTPTTKLAIGAPQWGVGDEWGLGPTMAKWGKTVVWGHGGSHMGGSSQLLWFPEKRAVLAFTMNSPTAFEPFSIRMTGDFAQALLGVRAPAAAKADGSVRVVHPERLVGTYVRYGVRYEISGRNGKLRYQEFNDFLSATYKKMNLDAGESGALVDQDLIPLGGDRFLVKFPGFENGMPIFFHGTDAQGRATSITSGLRTGGRHGAFQ